MDLKEVFPISLGNMLVTENSNDIKEEKTTEEKPKEESTKIILQPPQPEKISPKEEIGTEEEVKEEKALPKEESISETKTKRVRKRKKRAPVLYKSKMVKINGRYVFMIPSGFEIKTKEGRRPIMMRWDKSHG